MSRTPSAAHSSSACWRWCATPNDPLPILCEGIWEGRILREARGAHGFGYDPLFWVPERDCSSAELAPEEKNRLSHRARAMALLKQRLGL